MIHGQEMLLFRVVLGFLETADLIFFKVLLEGSCIEGLIQAGKRSWRLLTLD